MAKVKASKNVAKDVEVKDVEVKTQQSSYHRALQLVDGAVALAPLSRIQHIQVQQAIQELNRALDKLDSLKNKKIITGEKDG